MIRSQLLTPCLALTATFAVNAQTWIEVNAGQLPATAEVPLGVGALTQIDGNLDTGNDVDMYKIRVADASTFTCSSVGGATWDTQMWMFDTAGNGISFKDDDGPLQSTLTGQFLSGPQTVLIAISRYDNDAIDSNGDQIWNDTPFNLERQPDGPGAANPVDDWNNGAFGTAGSYSLFLTGAEYVDAGLQQMNFSIGGDPILVEPMLVTMMSLTNLPSLDIPRNNGLVGLSIYTQSFLYNPEVFPQDPVKTSHGLDFKIGVSTTTYGAPSGMLLWPTGSVVAQPGGSLSIGFSIQ